ncbi:hypothetical protein [Undibacterium fentianense]|uniref:DUF2782 domain-containing protein n=1 Tax=Undibacterium fentianense TaxID=2828728 RepID=A0A941E1B9_9BURK|nr:hypothetical protein [Undibacterium fentianense]MBR7799447.1 hypothetical protein [Undibacterium fentianense]
MKSSLKLISNLVAALIAISASPLLAAQEKTAPPPPKLEKLEEGPEADVKLIKPESNKLKTVERKENGKVTEVQVRTGKSTYTVKPNNAPKGTPEGDANRAAQWKVMEFGGKKESKEVESLPVLAPGPYSTSKTGSTKSVATPAAKAASSSTAATAASASSTSSSSSASMPPEKK